MRAIRRTAGTGTGAGVPLSRWVDGRLFVLLGAVGPHASVGRVAVVGVEVGSRLRWLAGWGGGGGGGGDGRRDGYGDIIIVVDVVVGGIAVAVAATVVDLRCGADDAGTGTGTGAGLIRQRRSHRLGIIWCFDDSIVRASRWRYSAVTGWDNGRRWRVVTGCCWIDRGWRGGIVGEIVYGSVGVVVVVVVCGTVPVVGGIAVGAIPWETCAARAGSKVQVWRVGVGSVGFVDSIAFLGRGPVRGIWAVLNSGFGGGGAWRKALVDCGGA